MSQSPGCCSLRDTWSATTFRRHQPDNIAWNTSGAGDATVSTDGHSGLLIEIVCHELALEPKSVVSLTPQNRTILAAVGCVTIGTDQRICLREQEKKESIGWRSSTLARCTADACLGKSAQTLTAVHQGRPCANHSSWKSYRRSRLWITPVAVES